MKTDWADKRVYRAESEAGWFLLCVYCALGLLFWWLFFRALGYPI